MKKEKILEFLKQASCPVGPTTIGLYFGQSYTSASSWCSSSLASLLKEGKIKRIHGGKYQYVDKIT